MTRYEGTLAGRPAATSTVLAMLVLLLCRPTPSTAQPFGAGLGGLGGGLGGGFFGAQGPRGRPDPSQPFQSAIINMMFGQGLTGQFGSIPAGIFSGGVGGGGPGQPFPQGVDVKELQKEPLSDEEFAAFVADVGTNLDAAAITSAALNLASGIVYTVSGALSTFSVGLSLTTIVPVFFFGLYGLGTASTDFLRGLQSDYGMWGLESIIDTLGKYQAIKDKIQKGTFVAQLEEQLAKVRQVRAMLKELRGSSPIAASFKHK